MAKHRLSYFKSKEPPAKSAQPSAKFARRRAGNARPFAIFAHRSANSARPSAKKARRCAKLANPPPEKRGPMRQFGASLGKKRALIRLVC